MEIIKSADNKFVKYALSLSSLKVRKYENCFVLEGEKLIKEAVSSGYQLRNIFVAETKANAYSDFFTSIDSACDIKIVSDNIFSKLCDTVNPQGIAAVAGIIKHIFAMPQSDFIVLDRVRDPANLGAILRSAAAAGFVDVYLLDCCDCYNPKTVRASMSGLFYTKCMEICFDEIKLLSDESGVVLTAADMDGQNLFNTVFDKNFKHGIVIGNEGGGISEDLLRLCKMKIAIPMKNIESLNAAVSAGIIMYQIAVQKS